MKRYFLLLLLFPATALAEWEVEVGKTTLSVPFFALDSTDGKTPLTTVASVACRRTKNGSHAACATSTVLAASGEVSDANSPGEWKYTLGSSDVDTVGSLVLCFRATGMDFACVPIQVVSRPSSSH